MILIAMCSAQITIHLAQAQVQVQAQVQDLAVLAQDQVHTNLQATHHILVVQI